MIEGAIIALAGLLVGRFLPGRHRKVREVKAICGCNHWRSFRDGGAGKMPIEHVRALVRLLFPEEMTPTAKRVIEAACDSAAEIMTKTPMPATPTPDEQQDAS